ncbi:MAG: Gfo/Idh/MocA family oxidoreductase [Candidatus Brocadiia bacterium]
MSAQVDVVQVAVGGYGASLLETLLELGQEYPLRLAGMVDPAPEQSPAWDVVQRLDAPLYGSLREFYREHGAGLAVIASPIHHHCPQTCLALAQGSHVMCEKPLGATVQEARRMAEARDREGRFVAIGYQWSFSPTILRLKEDIMAGRFGAPLRLRTLVLWPRDHAYYARNDWAGAVRDAEGRWILDSPVNNAVAHFLHNMLFCLGPERDRSVELRDVTGETYRANDIENYDTAALRCHTAGGVEVLYFCSHAVAEQRGPEFVYEFEDATLTIDGLGGEVTARFADGAEESYGVPDNSPGPKLRACLDAIRDGRQIPCGVEASSAQTLCMNGLHDSAGEIVDFPPSLVRIEGGRTYVEGLGQVLSEGYEAGELPSERQVPWAGEGRTVDLTDYGDFPGGG